MNAKQRAYNEAKTLATRLGQDISGFKSEWRRSTAQTWINRTQELRQDINFENTFSENLGGMNYNTAMNNIIQFNSVNPERAVVAAERLFDKITSNGKNVVKFNVVDDSGKIVDKWITLNSANKGNFVRALANTYVSYDDDMIDTWHAQGVSASGVVGATHSSLSSSSRGGNKDGGFFAYLNTSNIDLKHYQIFTESDINIVDSIKDLMIKNPGIIRLEDQEIYYLNKEHCLIQTFKHHNIAEAILNNIKLSYQFGENIKKKDIPKISEMVGRKIVIHSLNGEKIAKASYGSGEPVINLAIYENHYFSFEDTKYSRMSINKYDELKDEKDFWNITGYRVVSGKKYIEYSDKAKISSLLLVDKMFKAGYFKKLDMKYFAESSTHIALKDHIYLDNIEFEQRPVQPKKIKKNISKVYYADFETYVGDDVKNHEIQLLGVVSDKNDKVMILDINDPKKFNQSAKELIDYFLHIITEGGTERALCYFHNLKYDYQLMEKYLNITKRCVKDNQLYSVSCRYKGQMIEFRDSYKLLQFRISDFAETFKLPKEIHKKEAIAYAYYRKDNHNKIIPTAEYRALLCKKEQLIFDVEVKKCKSYNATNDTFNPMTYYKEYLRLDCLVLKKGLQEFNKMIKTITDSGDDKKPTTMDIFGCLTISSLTDTYMNLCGAYDNVYEVCGNLRAYIAKAVQGGRVHCNTKYVKKVIEKKIADYDGVSLYPSAIDRLCREFGLSQGKASRMVDFSKWEDYHYSIMTVQIKKVGKKQQMPMIAHRSECSIDYTNEAPKDPVIIDRHTLRDYINFHKIDYEIIDGVYWDSGGNNTMGKVIKKLFSSRLKYKKEGQDALANTIKLMLNSSYGKTIMKKTNTQLKILDTHTHEYNEDTEKWTEKEKTNFDNYVYNNFATIKEIRQISDKKYELKEMVADMSYNRGHIGSAILSMSKRIMNEVFDVANTNNLPIYYTDTDSIHMNWDDVSMLEKAYTETYQRELNGKQLGQFHTDFKLDGAKGDIYAVKSIFLGKKSYIDCLESVDKDGNKITGFHTRMKGMTEDGLEHSAKKYGTESYFGLYKDLANDVGVRMLLNPLNVEQNKQKVLFEFKNGNVSTKRPFYRDVCFGNKIKKDRTYIDDKF